MKKLKNTESAQLCSIHLFQIKRNQTKQNCKVNRTAMKDKDQIPSLTI